jgi:hypothetical protein
MQWLDSAVPEEELLVTPPVNSFRVEEIETKPTQRTLAF